MKENVLTEEQKKLIIKNYPLVNNFIKKSIETNNIPSFLIDDFISNTLWRFCIATLKFEEDRGFKFSTYAYGGFNFSLKKTLTEKNKKRYNVDIDEKVEAEVEFEYGFLEEFIKECDLKERELNIIIDRFYDKFTLSDIGKKYGFSRQYANIIIPKILKKMHRKAISKNLDMSDFYKGIK